MNFINLIGNSGIPSGPLIESPKESQARRKRSITMCGCGNHPVNPKKDVYKQHNHWLAQQHPKAENNFSKLHGIKSCDEK